MLRFRNRFRGSASSLHQCGCGLRFTLSREGGRETIIHELPWCDAFAEQMAMLRATEPSSQLHQALVVAEVGKDTCETIVVADGDDTRDVAGRVPPS